MLALSKVFFYLNKFLLICTTKYQKVADVLKQQVTGCMYVCVSSNFSENTKTICLQFSEKSVIVLVLGYFFNHFKLKSLNRLIYNSLLFRLGHDIYNTRCFLVITVKFLKIAKIKIILYRNKDLIVLLLHIIEY